MRSGRAPAPTCASARPATGGSFGCCPAKAPTTSAPWPRCEPLIAPWTAGVSDDELDLIRVTEYTFRAQIADRWRRGNVFLLGDAAHLTPPFIGQGMGAGLRDAMNLAWKLAGVLDGTLAPDLLDTYEQERKPHARQMIRLALAVGRSMTAGGEFGNLARRVVVPRMRLIPGLRAQGRRLGDAGACTDPRWFAAAESRTDWQARCARIRCCPTADGSMIGSQRVSPS